MEASKKSDWYCLGEMKTKRRKRFSLIQWNLERYSAVRNREFPRAPNEKTKTLPKPERRFRARLFGM